MEAQPLITLAIDPGKSGGMAIQFPDGKILLYEAADTESHLMDMMFDLVETSVRENYGLRAVLEKVGGFTGKGQPGSSMFTFGRGVGVIVGMLMALKIPFVEVTPQQWMKTLGLGTKGKRTTSQWKRHLLDQAKKRYPSLMGLNLKTADALLILEASTTNTTP